VCVCVCARARAYALEVMRSRWRRRPRQREWPRSYVRAGTRGPHHVKSTSGRDCFCVSGVVHQRRLCGCVVLKEAAVPPPTLEAMPLLPQHTADAATQLLHTMGAAEVQWRS
jgi:hypothetical protein